MYMWQWRSEHNYFRKGIKSFFNSDLLQCFVL
jgi:hypothetical protein